jgi:hypothetical protein
VIEPFHPFQLSFDDNVEDTIQDSKGVGTGFPKIQRNQFDIQYMSNSYQKALLSVHDGLLTIRATPGTSQGAVNSQVNGLEIPLDCESNPVLLHTRVKLNGLAKVGMSVGTGGDNILRSYLQCDQTSCQLFLQMESKGNIRSLGTAPVQMQPDEFVHLFLEFDPTRGRVNAGYQNTSGLIDWPLRNKRMTLEEQNRAFSIASL